MSLESSEVAVAGTGHIWRAPVGTSFPTNLSAAVTEANWTELGYFTPEGIKFKIDRDVNKVMGYQSMDALRIIVKSRVKEISATFLQFNQNTFATAQGGGTWTGTSPNFSYSPPADNYVDTMALIVEGSDTTYSYRFCYYNAMVTSATEFAFVREDAIMLPVTWEILANPTAGGSAYVFQTSDPNLGDYTQAGS